MKYHIYEIDTNGHRYFLGTCHNIAELNIALATFSNIEFETIGTPELSKKEQKRGKNIKTVLAIVFLLALLGAALDLIA